MLSLETFDDVKASITKNAKKRAFHLLLGNGFSMAYDSTIFSYNALHEFLSTLENKDLSSILRVVETRNFELIMHQLDTFSALVAEFGGYPELKTRVDKASASLKAGLLDAVRVLHPEHVFKVPEEKSAACSTFLTTFLDTGGSIFSTNYDLLLYWVLMRNSINHIDGCGRELENGDEYVAEEDQVWSELIWGKNREGQNVFYVHRALQFFDDSIDVIKEEYDTQNYLLEKITARMERGEYPVFVTAGDGSQKLQHIMHNQYLTHSYRSLCEIEGSLVAFGFNFGAFDEHIIDAINRAAHKRRGSNRLWSVYIGVYSDEDRDHIEQIRGRFKPKLHVYDAGSARVWG